MPEDISPELLAELLAPKKKPTASEGKNLTLGVKKFFRHHTQYPNRKGKYLRFYDNPKKCASRGCGTTTYTTYEGIPYCGVHGEYKLLEIIDRLESEVKRLQRLVGLNQENPT